MFYVSTKAVSCRRQGDRDMQRGQRDRDIKSWRERWGENEEGRDRKRMRTGERKRQRQIQRQRQRVRERWGENEER